METAGGSVSIGTMHLVKGLEFRGVAVMACDDEIIPLQERIEAVAAGADLEEVYNDERGAGVGVSGRSGRVAVKTIIQRWGHAESFRDQRRT